MALRTVHGFRYGWERNNPQIPSKHTSAGCKRHVVRNAARAVGHQDGLRRRVVWGPGTQVESLTHSLPQVHEGLGGVFPSAMAFAY